MKHQLIMQSSIDQLRNLGKEELPEHVVEGIKRGQTQLKKGLGKTSEEVFKKYGS